ncbi:CLUMA_CG007823, isoform A [Clunio marinus]|uniref:CLUMA_CG007823, isoform A n=1 Tax=Clunio marinus TaxID=568069 RepID=A0A1J1I3Y5_9DIPT|nr:CLUMA_CG007823, isoform A [Clunio marinus]
MEKPLKQDERFKCYPTWKYFLGNVVKEGTINKCFLFILNSFSIFTLNAYQHVCKIVVICSELLLRRQRFVLFMMKLNYFELTAALQWKINVSASLFKHTKTYNLN